jgi:hypothetical protein
MTPEEIVKEFKVQEREAYFKSHDDLMKVYEAFDRIILALSSGAIGLTFLLMKEPRLIVQIPLFRIALLSFLISLVAVVISHFFGILSFKRMMQAHVRRSDLEVVDIAKRVRPMQRLGDLLNFISGFGFVAGAVVLAIAVLQII